MKIWYSFVRVAWRLGWVIGLGATVVAPAAAGAELSEADKLKAQKFAGVVRWHGIFESSEQYVEGYRTDFSYGTWRHETLSHGSFVLERSLEYGWSPERGILAWRGKGTVDGTDDRTYANWDKFGVGEEGRKWMKGTQGMDIVEFTVELPNRFVSMHSGVSTGPKAIWRHEGRRVSPPHKFGEPQIHEAINESWEADIMTFGLIEYSPNVRRWWEQVQGGPGVFTLIFEEDLPDRLYKTGGGKKRSQVVLYPEYDDVECEVTIEGYADWLPQGNIDQPKLPGGGLIARAVLKSRTGKTKDLPQVDRFRFELLDTSREPGICLNWPLEAKDNDYDLKLANFSSDLSAGQFDAVRKFVAQWGLTSGGEYDAASLPAGGIPRFTFGTVSENGQKSELIEPPKDEKGQPFAEAAIESYDFGAKSELRVTCILRDGREIIGLMRGAGGDQDLIRLPKRAGPDWIAEKWRRDNGVMDLSASSDEEKVDGQPMNGDGFTLYEEYRGWIANGRHITGDPKRKDFFVLNQRGADFRGGIDMFQRLSQLRVHSNLRDGKEMSEDVRCMNLNHRDAPHRVDQHGVVLMRDNGPLGGVTVGVDGADPKLPFRPKMVARIYLEWSEAGRGTAALSIKSGMESNLSERDAEWAWDRAVAHELLHSVGVEHHGEGRHALRWAYFQGPGSPINPTGKPRYTTYFSMSPDWYVPGEKALGLDWSEGRGPTITLRWEDTKKDVFEDIVADYQRRLPVFLTPADPESSRQYYASIAARIPGFSRSPEWWAAYSADVAVSYDYNHRFWVGPERGTDSGDDLCVMRYYFADAYKINGQENAYYLIRPGTSRAGRQICHSPVGTGNNARDHAPQSRFGDATPGRGNCFAMICPNDAIPPRAYGGAQ